MLVGCKHAAHSPLGNGRARQHASPHQAPESAKFACCRAARWCRAGPVPSTGLCARRDVPPYGSNISLRCPPFGLNRVLSSNAAGKSAWKSLARQLLAAKRLPRSRSTAEQHILHQDRAVGSPLTAQHNTGPRTHRAARRLARPIHSAREAAEAAHKRQHVGSLPQ